MKRKWWIFHEKHLKRSKLKFIRWFMDIHPGKYCWADCVGWSMSPLRFNPFKVDSAKGCSMEETQCYCGEWENGKCWSLKSKAEKERILADREKDLPKTQVANAKTN